MWWQAMPRRNASPVPGVDSGKPKEAVMRTLFAAALLILTAAVPLGTARAQTDGAGPPMVTVDEARDIAAFNGVIIIRRIEFDEGVWKIEGRDRSDRRVEMRIDPESGEIAQLERFD
jgi:hypothetical protein